MCMCVSAGMCVYTYLHNSLLIFMYKCIYMFMTKIFLIEAVVSWKCEKSKWLLLPFTRFSRF